MRLAPPVTSISKRSAASAAPADSRRPAPAGHAQLLAIELDATGAAGQLQPDVHAGRPLEPGVVGAADKPDRDDARRLTQREPQLIDATGHLE